MGLLPFSRCAGNQKVSGGKLKFRACTASRGHARSASCRLVASLTEEAACRDRPHLAHPRRKPRSHLVRPRRQRDSHLHTPAETPQPHTFSPTHACHSASRWAGKHEVRRQSWRGVHRVALGYRLMLACLLDRDLLERGHRQARAPTALRIYSIEVRLSPASFCLVSCPLLRCPPSHGIYLSHGIFYAAYGIRNARHHQR